MSVKKTYNRYFIIFQEDDKGYGIAIDKQPTGYLKIETKNGKCKITVYVQNLKKEKGPYFCCMINTLKNPPLVARLGSIPVDETGRGETWWEYSEDNIADCGERSEKFSVAAILLDGDKVMSPLSGYACKEKVEWKSKITLKVEKVEVKKEIVREEEKVIENIADNEEAKKFREYEESIQDSASQNATQTSEVVDENKRDVEDEEVNDNNESETINQNEVNNDEYDDEVEDSAQSVENIIRQEEDLRSSKDKTHASMFHEVLSNFEEVTNLCGEMQNCKWWKIPYGYDVNIKENNYYPYFCAVYHLKMTYPYLNYIKYFKKCGYYYFGMKYNENNEVKYIMYGVEGNNSIQEQPYMGMTGFVKWVKIKDKECGMWLMYYNPYTGCIMVPKKKE